jgi:hypothetical protein
MSTPLTSPPQWLIDSVVPANEVHLLAGVSDAGKTRWLFHMLLEWEKGNSIFGLNSTPVPWLYVAGDRTERAAIRTLSDMGLNPASIPLLPAFGSSHKPLFKIFDEAIKRGAHLLVIEGFQKFVDGTGQFRDVQQFLENMSGYTDPTSTNPSGFTILGVVESPKLKPNERYDDPRQRVSGVSAWGYYSNTIFLIERFREDLKQGKDNPRRMMYVCPKQGKRLEIAGGFDSQGHLTFP